MHRFTWALSFVLVLAMSTPASAQRFVERMRLGPLVDTRPSSFGAAVAIDGSIAVVGAPAAVGGSGEIFVFDVGGSTPVPIFRYTSAELRGLGTSVAVKGTLIVAGAPGSVVDGNADVGAVAVFRRGTTGVTFLRRFSVPDAFIDGGARFGQAVAMGGPDSVVVGAPGIRTAFWFDAVSVTPFARAMHSSSTVSGYGGALAVGAIPATTAALVAIGTGDPSVVADVDLWAVGATGTGMPLGVIPNDGGFASFGNALAVDGLRVLVGVPDRSVVKLYGIDAAAGGAAPSFIDEWIGTDGSAFGRAVAAHGTLLFAGAPDVSSASGDRGEALEMRPEPLLRLRAAVRLTDPTAESLGASISFSGTRLLAGAPDGAGDAIVFEDGSPATCTTGDECAATEICIDGFCCNGDCGSDEGDCQSCAIAGAEGWCSVSSPETACATPDGLCTGLCDGESTICESTLECIDGGTPSQDDAGAPIDGGNTDLDGGPIAEIDAATAPPGVSFGGGGGCRCAAAGAGRAPALGMTAVGLLALVLARRRAR